MIIFDKNNVHQEITEGEVLDFLLSLSNNFVVGFRDSPSFREDLHFKMLEFNETPISHNHFILELSKILQQNDQSVFAFHLEKVVFGE